ncbi:MAG: ATP-binding cassette domain-containing protein [Chloroflexota bacterium]|nr:ATP-binding cassette domain-containing protein [Chloroflexota bacterium]
MAKRSHAPIPSPVPTGEGQGGGRSQVNPLPTDHTPAVHVERLTVRHIGRRAPALRDLSLEWAPGERLLLLGPSGAGKSTLALCLNGLIPHSVEAHWEAGRILVDGQDTRQASLGRLTRKVGLLFQDPEAQLALLEVDDEVAFGLENLGTPRPAMLRRVPAARALLDLDPARTPPRLDQLSGGTKQRVTLAAILAMGPGALVLDEPTANLDPQGTTELFATLADLCRDSNRSLLLVEHRLDDILALIERVIVLDERGTSVLTGPPREIFERHADTLDQLGVWVPQVARLATLFPGAKAPLTIAEAADLLVTAWPTHQSRHSRESGNPPPSAAAAILAAEDLSYRYTPDGPPALAEVDLTVRSGEFLALAGANAAGKTTLALLLAGALQPTTGRVLLDGRDLRAVPERDMRRRLAYVFQYPEHQFVTGTVRDELLFGLRARGVAAAAAVERALTALERIGLADLAAAHPLSLSHGQKRRLSVATALVTEPDVLLLDEPTFGQDRRYTDELLALLTDLHQSGTTVVVITHDMTLVAEHATRVVALASGHIVFDGPPAALFARPDLLTRCALRLPPIAQAVQQARELRAALPAVSSLRELAAALVGGQPSSP